MLLFFFSVHREFFFNRTNTDGPYIFSSDACLYCGCGRVLRKTWEMFEKDGFYSKKNEKDGDRKKQNTPTDHWWLQQDKSRKRGFLSLPNRHMHLTRFTHARTHVKE